MRLSLILGIIIASISLITVIILSTNEDIVSESDITSEYGCSSTLGIDKPSSIRWPEGLYVSPPPSDIKVYYCDIKGFTDIRFVKQNEFGSNEYEFVMRPGSTATITFLLDVSEEWIMDNNGKVYRGIKAMMPPVIPEPLFRSITYPEGFFLYPSSVQILSNEHVLVKYTIEVDKDIIERPKYVSVLGPNIYYISIFGPNNAFYISIRD